MDEQASYEGSNSGNRVGLASDGCGSPYQESIMQETVHIPEYDSEKISELHNANPTSPPIDPAPGPSLAAVTDPAIQEINAVPLDTPSSDVIETAKDVPAPEDAVYRRSTRGSKRKGVTRHMEGIQDSLAHCVCGEKVTVEDRANEAQCTQKVSKNDSTF